MAKVARNVPIALHPEQESSPKPIWERMEGEPPRWFLRFRSYMLMGRGRSLQAVVEQELTEKRQRRAKKDSSPSEEPDTMDTSPVRVSIPGAWGRASTQWKWKERAEAWDNHRRDERNQKLLAFLDHEAEYISKAQRLSALDLVMHGLMTNVLENPATGESYKNYLAVMKTILATIREIRIEMNAET